MANARFVLKSVKTSKERELSEMTVVGRGVLDGIALESDSCSRKHAALTVAAGTAYVEDTQSGNGTFVNGERISAKRVLEPGDRLSFSDEEFELLRIQPQEATVIRDQETRVAHTGGPRMPWPDVEWDDKDHTLSCTPQQLAKFQRDAKELREANVSAPPVSVPCLMFSEPKRTVPLAVDKSPRQEWIIGRRPDCDICVESGRVSAVHAKIVRTGPQWIAIDALSSNGMFVNNLEAGKQYLAAGDLLRFGDVECVFRLPPQTRRSTAQVSPGMRYLLIGIVACVVALLVGWYFF
jgi:pSer/pThr/pTyr-binding forkhead associated (FHA) protein